MGSASSRDPELCLSSKPFSLGIRYLRWGTRIKVKLTEREADGAGPVGDLDRPGTSSLLCSAFQQFAMLLAADTPTGKGVREAALLRRQKELIYEQPRCSVKSSGRQKQKSLWISTLKKCLSP